MNHLQLPHILTFIRANKWTFAKTMPQWPHEYVVKGELSSENQKLFEQFTIYIRKYGRDERFLGKHPVRQYLYIEGWKYWTMGAPIPETTIINRARGKHAVTGMANMVFRMLENGWEDADICNELGMEPEELIRLKYVTGFAKLFEDVEYQNAWETRKQIKIRQDYERKAGKKEDSPSA